MELAIEFTIEEVNCKNYKPILGAAVHELSPNGSYVKRKMHPILGNVNKCIKNSNNNKKLNNCSSCNNFCPKNI